MDRTASETGLTLRPGHQVTALKLLATFALRGSSPTKSTFLPVGAGAPEFFFPNDFQELFLFNFYTSTQRSLFFIFLLTMVTTILGLPDAEIDRLLAEAESRLATHGGLEQGPVVVSGAKAITTTASALSPSAGAPTEQKTEEKAEKFSVRVPQPAPRKKVSACLLTPPPRLF